MMSKINVEKTLILTKSTNLLSGIIMKVLRRIEQQVGVVKELSRELGYESSYRGRTSMSW